MIDCPNGDVRDVLPDYVNDRLGAHRRAEVERHVESCAACRDEVQLLRDLRATLRRAPSVNVEAIAAAIPPYRAPVGRGWTTGWRTAAAVAAIAIGGTSLALLLGDAPNDRDVRMERMAQAPTRNVDSGPSAAVPSAAVMPDGPSIPPAPAPARAGELALAGATIVDLSDGELSALMDDLESLDALPSIEIEGAQPLMLSEQEAS
jgi:anti-sigma factor RsiW